MELTISTFLLAIGAGLASVLSPCVLPVVPVVIAGSEQNDRLRPLLVVLGLSCTFMLMGAVSSLFGAFLIGKTRFIEQAGGVVILVMGLMVLADRSVFKKFYLLSNIPVSAEGRLGGLVLGMALGIVWVPCIGPMLSSILTMVGTTGELGKGILLLGFYSLGLAIPMLAVAYSSRLLLAKLREVSQSRGMRYVTGGVLATYGFYIAAIGNFAFK